MLMTKRESAQISSQTLIYILVLIVIAMVFLFGYQSIKTLNKKQNQVILIQFQNQLKNDVVSLSGDFGSIRIKEYKLPSGYEEICFVDLTNANSEDIINYPIIADSVKNGVQKNIFFLGTEDFETFYAKGLKLPVYPFSCFKPKPGSTKIAIEGLGDASLLKAPPNEEYCDGAQQNNLCKELESTFGIDYLKRCCEEYLIENSCCNT